MLTLQSLAKQAASSSTIPARLVRYYAPIGDRRDTLEPSEDSQIAQGQQQWLPKLIQTDATPIPEMMASPGKQSVIAGLLGGAAGAAGGAALGPHLGTSSLVGGAVGGAAVGGLSMLGRYLHQTKHNAHLKETMRRLPAGATKRDYDAEKQLGDAFTERYGADAATIARESCPHCGARLERGDDGRCNQCRKPWPEPGDTKPHAAPKAKPMGDSIATMVSQHKVAADTQSGRAYCSQCGTKLQAANQSDACPQCAREWTNKSASSFKHIEIKCRDQDNTLESLLATIKSVGNLGHTFDIVLDPSSEHRQSFEWDGDGGDMIKSVIVRKEKKASAIIPDLKFLATAAGEYARQHKPQLLGAAGGAAAGALAGSVGDKEKRRPGLGAVLGGLGGLAAGQAYSNGSHLLAANQAAMKSAAHKTVPIVATTENSDGDLDVVGQHNVDFSDCEDSGYEEHWPDKKAAQRTCECGTTMKGAWCPKCKTFAWKKKSAAVQKPLLSLSFLAKQAAGLPMGELEGAATKALPALGKVAPKLFGEAGGAMEGEAGAALGEAGGAMGNAVKGMTGAAAKPSIASRYAAMQTANHPPTPGGFHLPTEAPKPWTVSPEGLNIGQPKVPVSAPPPVTPPPQSVTVSRVPGSGVPNEPGAIPGSGTPPPGSNVPPGAAPSPGAGFGAAPTTPLGARLAARAPVAAGSAAATYLDPNWSSTDPNKNIGYLDKRRLGLTALSGAAGFVPGMSGAAAGHAVGGVADMASTMLTGKDPGARYWGAGVGLASELPQVGRALGSMQNSTNPLVQGAGGVGQALKGFVGTPTEGSLMAAGGNRVRNVLGGAAATTAGVAGGAGVVSDVIDQKKQQGFNEAMWSRESQQAGKNVELAENAVNANDMASLQQYHPDLVQAATDPVTKQFNPAKAKEILHDQKMDIIVKNYGVDKYIDKMKASMSTDLGNQIAQQAGLKNIDELKGMVTNYKSMMGQGGSMGAGAMASLSHMADGLLSTLGMNPGQMSGIQKILVLLGGLGLIGGALGGSGMMAGIGGAGLLAGLFGNKAGLSGFGQPFGGGNANPNQPPPAATPPAPTVLTPAYAK